MVCYLSNNFYRYGKCTSATLPKFSKKEWTYTTKILFQKVINKKTTDIFADHFAIYFENSTSQPKLADICKKISCKILWQGNPLSMAKLFGKSVCKLCMQERISILNYHRKKALEPY